LFVHKHHPVTFGRWYCAVRCRKNNSLPKLWNEQFGWPGKTVYTMNIILLKFPVIWWLRL
jgi:hypothetical protein